MFKGEVADPGFGHFRKYGPKFYQTVLALSGMALYPGTSVACRRSVSRCSFIFRSAASLASYTGASLFFARFSNCNLCVEIGFA
jgi:hypothetical protein